LHEESARAHELGLADEQLMRDDPDDTGRERVDNGAVDERGIDEGGIDERGIDEREEVAADSRRQDVDR
jgi:hypothetical protein